MSRKFITVEECIVAQIGPRSTSYRLSIRRDGKFVRETYYTIEDARRARDEILDHYDRTKDLKHSSTFQRGNLQHAQLRYGDAEISYTKLKGDKHSRYVATLACVTCGKKFTLARLKAYNRYLDRGRRCKGCHLARTAQDRADRRNECNKANATNYSTGIKNISQHCRTKYYIVTISRRGKTFCRAVNELEEAIELKKRVLDYYADYDVLPRNDEI